MGLTPNFKKVSKFKLKQCSVCGQTFGPENYIVTKSPFYPDGALPMCNDCINNWLEEHDFDWAFVDKLCQMIDVPFVPKEWERLFEMNGTRAFPKYAEIFLDAAYDGLGWDDYFKEFKALKEEGHIEDELPALDEKKQQQQRERWGGNYDQEALNYLDNLYTGLMNTQNVNGALQVDQAVKICKISYEIDQRIAGGEDFDKLLTSYDKLVKTAEFTPKNIKNINDFDTCGELVRWMEKRGWRNKYYDNVTRDIVDETIKNIQAFNQRLYTNESGIGDEITRRIEALKSVKEMEDYYGTGVAGGGLDEYENAGYNNLFKDLEDSEFAADLSGDENAD